MRVLPFLVIFYVYRMNFQNRLNIMVYIDTLKTILGWDNFKTQENIGNEKEARRGSRQMTQDFLFFQLHWFLSFDSISQLTNELLVYERINVLSEIEEDKPVSDLALAGN